jgi:hypothetical protein
MDQYYSGAAEVSLYTCHRATGPIAIDGRLDEPDWRRAPQSRRFVDVITGRPALFDTRAAALWDDENLYVGFWLEEPSVEAALTERDAIVFSENDVEVFIDGGEGGDCYYEFEINALGTIYEVFFVWRDAFTRGGRFDRPAFDLYDPRTFSFGGNYDRSGPSFWRGTHPRGVRWAFTGWDFPGLRSAVQIDGTLNDRSTVDRGWRVELAFPWAGMADLANGRTLPPQDGDEWRIFFGRFERLPVAGTLPEPQPAWCWGAHGTLDTHMPEQFTHVTFSTRAAPERHGEDGSQ